MDHPTYNQDKKLELIARRLAAQYHDPDALIVDGEAYRVNVPGGTGYIPDLQRARPLWTAYLSLARVVLDSVKTLEA